MTLSHNKQILAVCERHRGDPSTYIVIYNIKSLFKQGLFKERLRINVTDLYPPGVISGAKDLSAHHSVHHGGTFSPAQKFVISLRFSQDFKFIGVLVSSDPNGNGDVKAFVFQWIEPTGKDSAKQPLSNRIVAHYEFPKQASNQTVRRLTFNPRDNNQVITTGNGHWRLWRL